MYLLAEPQKSSFGAFDQEMLSAAWIAPNRTVARCFFSQLGV
jgi:hypothetical protein